MNRVAIVQFVRLNSHRLPRKLLEVVGGIRLIDRGLNYLRRLSDATGATAFVGVSPRDAELADAVNQCGLRMLRLDDRGEQAASWPELIGPFAEQLRAEFDFVWDANICCRPFLRLETGEFLVRQCQAAQRPFVGVTRKRGIVWTETSPVPVIGMNEIADTRRNPHYFELAHLAYGWPVWALRLDESQLAKLSQPLEIPLDWAERIDIDTADDLAHARAVANRIQRVSVPR
jgi:hypothetical protein